MIDINSPEVEELISLLSIELRTVEININNLLGRYNLVGDIKLASGIGDKTYDFLYSN